MITFVLSVSSANAQYADDSEYAYPDQDGTYQQYYGGYSYGGAYASDGESLHNNNGYIGNEYEDGSQEDYFDY